MKLKCGVNPFYLVIHIYIYIYFLSDEGPMLETLDYTIRIGSTQTFLYFDLYLYSAYVAHYVYYTVAAVSVSPPPCQVQNRS